MYYLFSKTGFGFLCLANEPLAKFKEGQVAGGEGIQE